MQLLTAMLNPDVLSARSLIGLKSALAQGSLKKNLHVCCVEGTTLQTTRGALKLQKAPKFVKHTRRTDIVKPTRKLPPVNNTKNYPTLVNKNNETAGEFQPAPVPVRNAWFRNQPPRAAPEPTSSTRPKPSGSAPVNDKSNTLGDIKSVMAA
ncbi:hypothetical protein EVAR_90267_1 [Eumeta japonica]|uniref:Uncharacterized protein n=1 Tax=Eumeta variegata TaxID=151549 RepID=A0A4C2AG86_EUMVA|nr:hypothetical protein EVAR_90267_1 [Eumeta japonica]